MHKQAYAEAITINGPEGFKSPLSSGFDFLFGWLWRDKLLVKKDYLSGEWEITSSSTQQMMSCKHSAVPFFWWSKRCQPLLVSITIVAAPYSHSYIYRPKTLFTQFRKAVNSYMKKQPRYRHSASPIFCTFDYPEFLPPENTWCRAHLGYL